MNCPNYQAPGYYIDPTTDKGYEGSAWCYLMDKACLMEYGSECEEYDEWLKEEDGDPDEPLTAIPWEYLGGS